jgi:fibronectin-binding autotransporter adhesin
MIIGLCQTKKVIRLKEKTYYLCNLGGFYGYKLSGIRPMKQTILLSHAMTENRKRLIISRFAVLFLLALLSRSAFAVNYYTFSNGDWATPGTWTQDPSGLTSIGPGVPGVGDNVFIINGRSVFTSINRIVNSTSIQTACELDLGSSIGHNLGTVTGQGKLIISSGTFPGGTYTTFVASAGGTIEYRDYNGTLPNQLTYNNLIISSTGGPSIVTTLPNPSNPTNYTLNGDLSVLSTGAGSITFILGTAATNVINLDVAADISVSTNAVFGVGSFNAIHNLSLTGNFDNDGSVLFSNSPQYTASTNGAVNLSFTGANNSVFSIDGTTNIYTLTLNKGVDFTYVLDLVSSNVSFFNFYSNATALNLVSGTLKWGNNLSQTRINGGGLYTIPSAACLWISGGDMLLDGNVGGIEVDGRYRISSGNFSAGLDGLVFGFAGTIIIEGGVTTVEKLRPLDSPGVHTGSLTISGGTLNVDGSTVGTGDSRSPRFSLPYPGMGFYMTGGVINVANPEAGIATNGGIFIGVNLSNSNVTAGTVNVTVPGSGTNFNISSSVPFFNLSVSKSSAGSATLTLGAQTFGTNYNQAYFTSPGAGQALVVRRDFTLNTGNNLTFITNNFNVTVGRNFTINTGCTYTPGTNTTTFNGTGTQQFVNTGTITSGLHNLTITKVVGQSLVMSGTAPTFTVLNNLTVTLGSFNSGGKQILCHGNIFVSGTCLGSGAIQLVGTGAQVISGSGTGIFNNLSLNKASGSTTMTANFQISGILRLANTAGVLDIGNRVLFFTAAARIYDDITGVSTTNFSSSRMIQTLGQFSDGGIRKNYNLANSSFLYPYGSGGKYTPATISISGTPTSYGFIFSRPVNERHPVATSSEAIPYYWRTNSTGFVLGAAVCNQTYRYNDADVFLVAPATEADYVPAKFNASTVAWEVGPASDVDESTNSIAIAPGIFGGGIDGEYTCGSQVTDDPFANVIVFYSIRDGIWEDTDEATTPWSVRGHDGDPTSVTPGPNNPVLIGDGVTYFHTVTSGANGEKAGYIFIAQGSFLDVNTTTGHDFSVASGAGVTGSGTIRLSSSSSAGYFPAGDFGVFLSATGGSVEYYTVGTSFTMPTTTAAPDLIPLNVYNNLTLSPTSGFTITMPDMDLTVLKTFKVSGSPIPSPGQVRHNNSSSKILTVNGLFLITGGELVFRNGSPQTIIANSNLIISNGGAYLVSGSGAVANNHLTLKANLTNDGIFDMSESGRFCDVLFTGNANRQIGGTNASAYTEFNKMTIDKGPAPERTMDITTAGSFVAPSDNWLTLVTGGLRLSKGITLTMTNTGTNFNIPTNTQLTVNHPSAVIEIGQAASDAADLILGGKLVLISGSVKVGIAGSNNNQDIEYSFSGSPEIDVRNNSTLFVNGQIRRNLGTLDGSLIYKQSGTSTVEIVGANANFNRAKLEVLNPASVFNLSDNANVIVRRGGGVSFADVYLEPASSLVTGGTLTFQTENINSNQQYQLESLVPLHHLTIQGFDSDDQSTVRLFNSTLTLNGNLTISNDNSVLNANGKGLVIKGNMVNNNSNGSIGISVGGFRPGNNNQLTRFASSSGNQTISGVPGNLTNFARLTIDNSAPAGIVSLNTNTNLRVSGILTINTGTLQDGGNTITTGGNIINNSVHESTGSGSITCVGPSTQNISGNGSGRFGNLVINNGSSVTTSATITVNNNLDLQSGIFNIQFYLLKLGEACSVTGTFSGTRMIRTNGTPVDSGVMKMFPSGAGSFVFPIGTSANYTPVTYNITSNSAPGTIRVAPVAVKHPATTLAADEQLNYFWNVQSTGFSGLTVNHQYQYIDAFVTGTEANYVTGRYVLPQWNPLGGFPGTVNTTLNQMNLTGVNFITGDYTCGDPLEFQQIDTLYSRNATLGGAWDDVNTWSLTGHGGPPAGVIPTFQILYVKNGHTVNTNGDNRTCSVLFLEGVLDTEDDNLIVLGFCDGSGRLRIASNGSTFNFPLGNFNPFNSAGAGTVEYYGSVDGIMTPSPFYNNLEFSGTSSKTMGNVPFIVNRDLTINGGTFKTNVFNQTFSVKRNWVNNVGTSGFEAGLNTVIFDGVTQTIGGTGATEFYNVEFGNNGNKFLGNNIVVNNDLTIDAGVILDVTASNYNIEVNHDWVNNGTFNAREGNVDLNGTSLQTLGGTTVTQFFNLTQNNLFDVNLGSDQSLKNTLTVNAGDFNTTGRNFTLLSDLTRTGRIAPLVTGDVQGSIIQQRLAPGPNTGWAMLGAPVSGQKINQWTDDFATSGFIGSTGSVGNFISMYTYDEGDLGVFGAPTAYIPITDAGVDPLIPGVGYWTFLGTGLTTTANIMIDAQGPVVKGTFNFNPTFTSSGSLPDDGWNLVANPYPSAINWDAPSGWSRSKIDDAIYIYNADGAQYAAWVSGVSINGGVPEIGSSQGFYVKANAVGPSLSCTEFVKSTGNPTFLRQGRPSTGNSSDIIRMTLNGNGKSDEAVVRFHPEASSAYDGQWDAYKWDATDNSIASVSTLSGDDNLAINSIPADFAKLSIPVKVLAGISGTYELSFQGIEMLQGVSCFVIEDLKTGEITDLKGVDKLVFESEAGRESARFLIHIEKSMETEAIAASCSNIHDGAIRFTNLGGRDLSIRDEQGKEIAHISGKAEQTINNLREGTYFVSSSGSLCTAQVEPIVIGSGSVSQAIPSYTLEPSGEYSFSMPVEQGIEVEWTIDGNQLNGSSVNYAFSQAGDYSVTVKLKDGQCIEEKNLLLSVTGAQADAGIRVLPDGSGNYQVLVSDYEGDLRVELLNTAGQLLAESFSGKVTSGSRVTLKTSEFSEGIYLVKMITNQGPVIRKIEK